MKALVKTIAFLIFWTSIIYEGHIYLFIILIFFVNQCLQQKISKCQIVFEENGSQG